MNMVNEHILQFYFDDSFENIRLQGYGGFGFTTLDTLTHCHNDFYEITCITSGIYYHNYKDKSYALTPGTLLLMSPHSVHQLYTEPLQATFFAICIQEDYFRSYLKQHFPEFSENALSKCTVMHLNAEDTAYLEYLGHQLSVSKPPLYAADMITYLTLTNIFRKKNEPHKKTATHVQRILNILNEPANLHISAKQLYATVDVSTATLIKSFKEQTGYTIVEYKSKKRMDLAASMLKDTNKKVIDIAYELHYDSLNYFLRAFKKEFGVTPTEYRKIYRLKP